MMSDQVDVIVSGHLCLDLIPRMANVTPESLALPGRIWEVGPIDIATGGPVSNTGLALYRLGVKVGLMSAVGDDLLGKMIMTSLENWNPALSQFIAVRPGQSSSYSVVLSPGQRDRSFLHCTGTNSTFDIDQIDFSRLAGVKIFHLGYPPLLPSLVTNDGAGLQAIFQQAKTTGVVTSLDMAMPDPNSPAGQADWRAILKNALPHVDIFLPSIEEIVFMLRREDYDAWQGMVLNHLSASYLSDLAGELLDMGTVIAGFKLGPLGMYLRTAEASRFQRLTALTLNIPAWALQTLWMPAYQVEVIGTTGAGDSAYAGFLAALLQGSDPLEALRWACAVGACNVEAADSVSGVRTWQETAARMVVGWPLRPERLPGF